MTVLPDALIGHTGFVGGTLDRSGRSFGARFNSRNIGEMRGGRFGTVVCAGVSAVKWMANKEPEADRAGIRRLTEVLETVAADRFVLVSTTDVYPNPAGVTEADMPAAEEGQPYGRHRLELERWVAGRFAAHAIVRLPALFGTGLRKNIIFDLLTGNQVDRISPNGVFQWYPMRRFAADLDAVLGAGLRLVNIAPEPVPTTRIVAELFPGARIGEASLPAARYDMRTRHAALLGGRGDYHLDADQVMAEMAAYVAGVRASGGVP